MQAKDEEQAQGIEANVFGAFREAEDQHLTKRQTRSISMISCFKILLTPSDLFWPADWGWLSRALFFGTTAAHLCCAPLWGACLAMKLNEIFLHVIHLAARGFRVSAWRERLPQCPGTGEPVFCLLIRRNKSC